MSKGGIAQIMGKTCSTDNAAQLREMSAGQSRVTIQQYTGTVIAQRASDTGHLQTVRQAIVHENAPWQREYLRLVL